MVPTADVSPADRLRDEQLDLLADQLVARVAEHRLRARVDELDLSRFVHADHRVGSELEELALERLTRVVRHVASIDQAIVGSRQESCASEATQSPRVWPQVRPVPSWRSAAAVAVTRQPWSNTPPRPAPRRLVRSNSPSLRPSSTAGTC